jgi:hypothetical protein
MSAIRHFLLLSAFISTPVISRAQPDRSPLSTGYIYQFGTGIDDGGGEISSHFFHVRAGVPLYREEGKLIALSAAYQLNAFEFSGGSAGGFAALDPWGDIHTARLSAPIRWEFGERWSFFGLPSIRSVGESGAGFGDSLSGGFLLGASYKFGERLTLGPGIGYISQMEDDASIFPIILIDWKLTDTLSLTTGPSVGATQGPGLALSWDISDRLRLSLGARYEKLRFRLDSASAASPGGIGEDRSIPVFAGLTLQATDHWKFSLLGGVGFGNELSVEDDGGNSVSKSDYDPSPFIGVNASFSF